jgi:RimJ/RimL family protein N-acetyltransferase
MTHWGHDAERIRSRADARGSRSTDFADDSALQGRVTSTARRQCQLGWKGLLAIPARPALRVQVTVSCLFCRVRAVNDDGERTIALRAVQNSDLDALFDQMRDPASVTMAAFTPDNPDDRKRFDAHMLRLMDSPEITLRVVTWRGELVGSIASFVVDERTEVTYWIDRAVWGRGIASRALTLFLDLVRIRPLYARAASDNVASLRVLEKAGFRFVDTEVSFAPARGAQIEETILRLP